MSVFKSSGNVPGLFLFSFIKRETAADCGVFCNRRFSAEPSFFVLNFGEESFFEEMINEY